MLADLVRTDRHNHRPIAGDSADAEAIKVLARGHQNLIWARTRHTNKLRNALREYYPAALEAFGDLADRDALAVLGRSTDTRHRRPAVARSDPGRAANVAAGNATSNDEPTEIQAALRTAQLAAPDAVAEAFAATTAPRSGSSAS